ncbi:MAG TPA: hypothetical protein VMT63_12260 [Bacteroidales bacterium]|nr:hypothetical protein [Bacteroidales bacterium]
MKRRVGIETGGTEGLRDGETKSLKGAGLFFGILSLVVAYKCEEEGNHRHSKKDICSCTAGRDSIHYPSGKAEQADNYPNYL